MVVSSRHRCWWYEDTVENGLQIAHGLLLLQGLLFYYGIPSHSQWADLTRTGRSLLLITPPTRTNIGRATTSSTLNRVQLKGNWNGRRFCCFIPHNSIASLSRVHQCLSLSLHPGILCYTIAGPRDGDLLKARRLPSRPASSYLLLPPPPFLLPTRMCCVVEYRIVCALLQINKQKIFIEFVFRKFFRLL